MCNGTTFWTGFGLQESNVWIPFGLCLPFLAFNDYLIICAVFLFNYGHYGPECAEVTEISNSDSPST